MENVFNQSIWGDEGFSAILSMKPLPQIIEIIARDTSPPLWNITEWIVFNTLGTDEIYIRGLAFTYFLLAVFFTYKIGELIWSKKTGLLASILTFLNPFFFIYAFEGRMYSILALGVTASMYFFLKILKSEGKVKKSTKIGYVIATLWALYSHHFAIFALFVQGIWFTWEFLLGKRKVAKKLFKLFIIVGVGYIPWLWPLYNQTRMVGGGFWLGTPTLIDLRNLIYEYLAEGIKTHPLVVPFVNLKLHQLALYFVLAVLLIRKWHKTIKSNFILLTWFLIPILATWAVSQVFQSIFFNRYLLYTIPAAMLLLASNRRGKLSIAALSVIILLFANIDYYYFTHPTKLPFRELSDYVKSERQEGSFLINWNAASHHLWETKYYGIPAPIYIPPEGGDLPFFVGTALMQEKDVIREIPAGAERVGVVTSGPIEEISLPGYTEKEAREFNGLKFIWYVKEGSQ